MSNTQIRILSAFIMFCIFLGAVLVGPQGLLFLLLIVGAILVDEIIVHMFKLPRKHLSYSLSMVSYLTGFVYFNYLDVFNHYVHLISNAGICLSLLLILYLFMEKMEAKYFIRIMKRNSFMVGLYVLIPFLSLSYLLHQKNWIQYVVLLVTLNFLVDTGAWFFGKNFGKKKLWPKISPNKTLVGLAGGVLTSLIISSGYVYINLNVISLAIVFSIAAVAILAQVGDLIESKMKRQLGVKDSSNLIPGHGGIYDRIDSLIFIAPFFALMVRNLL